MELNDGSKTRTVALAISLTPTGKIVTDPVSGREHEAIDGSFTIDDEGGPYSFNSVSYSVERNELDLRYSRSAAAAGTSPSFRLVGKVAADDSLKGNVSSGFKGIIGTFQLALTKEPRLEVVNKYYGTWAGKLVRLDGSTSRITITIEEAGGAQITNPSHFELDTTRGRLAHTRTNGIPLDFNSVVIDYLRRKIYLLSLDAGGRPTMTFEAVMDEKTRELEGFSNGVFSGRNGEFRLKYVE